MHSRQSAQVFGLITRVNISMQIDFAATASFRWFSLIFFSNYRVYLANCLHQMKESFNIFERVTQYLSISGLFMGPKIALCPVKWSNPIWRLKQSDLETVAIWSRDWSNLTWRLKQFNLETEAIWPGDWCKLIWRLKQAYLETEAIWSRDWSNLI